MLKGMVLLHGIFIDENNKAFIIVVYIRSGTYFCVDKSVTAVVIKVRLFHFRESMT